MSVSSKVKRAHTAHGPLYVLLSALLYGVPHAGVASALESCALNPLPAQLETTALRSETQQYAMTHYRSQLLRYVSSYYGGIAGDLLRGDGEYLQTLHTLMGSAGEGAVTSACTAVYRQLLLQENASQAFALALWQMRVAPPVQ